MLQLGFGYTPFESGMITFLGAVGAMGSKFLATKTFARYGFRNVLTIGSVISCLFVAVNAFFYPGTPVIFIMASLLVGGVLRSTCFTGINAMAFSDIDEADSSQATAINAVAQQISIALGVAVGGGVLDIASSLHGGGIRIADFHIAFLVVAAISACAAFTFYRMPRNAGSQVSGHHMPAVEKP
jgi:Na+/melibiose symporter-like transporter